MTTIVSDGHAQRVRILLPECDQWIHDGWGPAQAGLAVAAKLGVQQRDVEASAVVGDECGAREMALDSCSVGGESREACDILVMDAVVLCCCQGNWDSWIDAANPVTKNIEVLSDFDEGDFDDAVPEGVEPRRLRVEGNVTHA